MQHSQSLGLHVADYAENQLVSKAWREPTYAPTHVRICYIYNHSVAKLKSLMRRLPALLWRSNHGLDDFQYPINTDLLQYRDNNCNDKALEFWNKASKDILLVAKANPSNFLRSESFMRCLHPPLREQEGVYFDLILQQEQRLRQKLLDVAVEDPCGTPLVSAVFPLASPLSLQHISHIIRMRESGIDLNDYDYIIDIGGGYGAFAKTVLKLGFKGIYRIVDLPVMLSLQKSYLGSIRNGMLADRIDYSSIDSLSDCLPSLARKKVLCVATWSLSEMPISTRKKVDDVLRYCDSFYIVFQEKMGEINNLEYFLSETNSDVDFTCRLSELPEFKGNYSLVGIRHK